jgi:hypothetical protein
MILLPVPTSSSAKLPADKVHGESARCPFAGVGAMFGCRGSCCGLYTKTLAMHLLFFGADDLAWALYKDRSPRQALTFATKLRAYRAELENALHVAPLEVRQRMNVELRFHMPGISWGVPPEETYEALEVTAEWFDKVGRLGFGIRRDQRTKHPAQHQHGGPRGVHPATSRQMPENRARASRRRTVSILEDGASHR